MDNPDTEKTFSISGIITLDGEEKKTEKFINKCIESCRASVNCDRICKNALISYFTHYDMFGFALIYLDTTPRIHVTESDDKGKFRIENIPEGKYTLIASRLGFDRYRQDITIDRNLNNIKINLVTTKFKFKDPFAGKNVVWINKNTGTRTVFRNDEAGTFGAVETVDHDETHTSRSWHEIHQQNLEVKRVEKTWKYFILLVIIGVVCYGGYKYFKKS